MLRNQVIIYSKFASIVLGVSNPVSFLRASMGMDSISILSVLFHYLLLDKVWSILNKFKQVWTNLNNFGQVWTGLDKIKLVKTCFNLFDDKLVSIDQNMTDRMSDLIRERQHGQWSILSQFYTHVLIIVTIDHNCHICWRFSKLSQLSCQNCHLSKLVTDPKIDQNSYNW